MYRNTKGFMENKKRILRLELEDVWEISAA
jgi:hypothetical protein